MTKAVFDKIAEGLQEALAVAKGIDFGSLEFGVTQIARVYENEGVLKTEIIEEKDFYAIELPLNPRWPPLTK